MSGNDSSTGGYLQPLAEPVYDDALTDIITAAVVGITGLYVKLVRPRWQPIPVNRPDINADWCAVGASVTEAYGEGTPEQRLRDDGTYELVRPEIIHAMAMFYGPNGQKYAQRLRDGLFIEQNRDVLISQGLNLVDVDSIVIAPDKVNNIWVRRYDIAFALTRSAITTYPILPFLSASGTITDETGGHSEFNASAGS